MSVQTATELEAFHRFLTARLEGGAGDISPEQAVRQFRTYQQELERFRSESAEAFAQAERGQTKPLDVDGLLARVAKRGQADGE